ncbi:MAG: hypothetical protein PF501_07950 [Salinisphaera sp.]|jgi:hypothetical protein|nr:hypothetical protein [Salinisphaera sp.]
MNNHTGKIAGGAIATTITAMAGFAFNAAGWHVPADLVAAGASFIGSLATFFGAKYD